jgi:hypothetical protein
LLYGVPRRFPDTITYSVAARTTVMATIKIVAITGLTPSSCFIKTPQKIKDVGI